MDVKRGDIWYIKSGYMTTGSEQRSGRPAVIVSNDKNNQHSTTVEVVYFTTQQKHDLPTHVVVHGTCKRSIALCEQITTVSVERIGDYCGCVSGDEMAHIKAAMMISLGLMPVEEDKPAALRQHPSSQKYKRNALYSKIGYGETKATCLWLKGLPHWFRRKLLRGENKGSGVCRLARTEQN